MVIFTYITDIQTVVEAMKVGADDYVTKEKAAKLLISIVEKHIMRKKVKNEFSDNESSDIFIPDHPEYIKVFDIALSFAQNGLDFLIQADTGTGKSVMVQYIYKKLALKGPLVDINCGSIPEHLAESELFGHSQGSFTGANKNRVGKFELAHDGILFLDEIGNMPITLQQKILKAIEEKKISRVGSNKEININFLLISATNKDLHKEVENQALRKDLYYRISTPTITLPALEDYPEVIPDFINFFIKKYNKEMDKKFKPAKKFIADMQAGVWEGNIRDLTSVR